MPDQLSEAIRLRRATSLDAAWLAEFGARTFRAAYAHLMDEREIATYCNAAYGATQQDAELRRTDSVVLLAEASGERLGFCWVVREPAAARPRCITDAHAIHLSRIYVSPEAQGRGIGALLLDGAVTEARGFGGETLYLAVWEKNPRAIAFYERHHFAEVGRDGFPTDPDPACDLVMARWLGACC